MVSDRKSHRRNKEMAASHGRIQHLQIQDSLGRVQLAQLGFTLSLGPAVALEFGGLGLEGFETLFRQGLQGPVDNQVHQFLGGEEAAAVLAGVGVGADEDLAVAAADRLALQETLVD